MALIYQDQFLHRRYAKPGKIENLCTHDKLVLDMLKKGKHSGSGKTFHEPVIVSNPQGSGTTIAAAQDVSEGGHAGSEAVVAEWTLPYGDYFAVVEIKDKDIAAGGDVPDGAYLKTFGLQTDGIIDEAGEYMDSLIFSEKGQAMGSYSGAAIAAGVMTLTGDAAETQIMNFNLGGAWQVADADASTPASASLLGSGTVGYVVGVDYDNLTVTFSPTKGGSAATPTGWDTSGTNYLFRSSFFQGTGGGNTAVFVMDSFADWVPSSAPSSESFKGVTRGTTIDSRLCGARLTSTQAAGLSTEERIKRLVTKLNSVFGGKGEKLVVMESIQWQKLASRLEKANGTRPLNGQTANMGYQYLQLSTGRGTAKVIAAPKCRPDTAWALEIDKWTLRTLNGFPKVMNADGFQMLRKAGRASYEFRINIYGHLSTPYPSRHGRTPIDVSA
jgi:hypothetical protein